MTKFKYQIETRHLSVLPKQGYDTGKPNKVVFHWTANDNSTIEGEINYMKNNWKAAFVHAFVNGDKTIEVADTDYKAYGAGKFANSDSIHMELCSEKDKAKMLKSIDRAAHYLAVQLWYYKLPCTDAVPKGKGTVWTHHAVSKFRGNTNHTDPDGYFDRWGIKWTDVFNKIKEYHTALNKNGDTTGIEDFGATTVSKPEASKPAPTPNKPSPAKSIETLANETIAGKHGSGDDRKKALGSQYDAVQKRVNEMLNSKPAGKSIDTLVKETLAGKHGNGDARKKSLGTNYNAVMKVINGKSTPTAKPAAKSIETLANETIAGKHGSGEARKKSLGSNYNAVQKRVNEILGGKKSASKSLNTIADEVIKGLWGNGQDRTNRLKKAGYNPNEVQKLVNKKL